MCNFLIQCCIYFMFTTMTKFLCCQFSCSVPYSIRYILTINPDFFTVFI
ncbi:hypothetical protein BMETH_2846_0 [methanotrophic bacterial endosymbiont of Bathymodiolus sp.]|nr:hypothetical protein BMETH_2846_0 [methanotrophic bacterial endosymbiont of Bathymodiolus sp.]